jgi:aquaporin Z
MEVPGGHKNKFTVLLYEFLGTCFFLLCINWQAAQPGPGAMWVGLCLYVNVLAFGSVSGGHFNPAVTLAVFLKEASIGRNSTASNGVYAALIVVAQVLGGLCGAFISQNCAKGLTDTGHIAILCPGIGAQKTKNEKDPCDISGGGSSSVILVEFLCTFMFIFFIINVKYHNTAKDDIMNCVCVGLCLVCTASSAAKMGTGGCLNPAVAIAQTITMSAYNKAGAGSIFSYLIGTFGGGFAAGIMGIARGSHDESLKRSAVNDSIN